MATHELESAVLFTPGRASYITTNPEGGFQLNLTGASQQRADIAAERFDYDFHTCALFAGGDPSLAENWPTEHRNLPEREATLMARPLEGRLYDELRRPRIIPQLVKKQGDSNNSIGDVRIAVERGLLNPDDFHTADRHGVDLVAGKLHGTRFRHILVAALDINPDVIRRADVHDPYGRTATEFRRAEPKPTAIFKECAAIALNTYVLRHVRPGNIDDLHDAEDHFASMVTR